MVIFEIRRFHHGKKRRDESDRNFAPVKFLSKFPGESAYAEILIERHPWDVIYCRHRSILAVRNFHRNFAALWAKVHRAVCKGP
jgi:hypothetical protein